MATRPPTQSPNRQGNYGGGGNGGNSVDVGAVSVARMAREDTRWFIAGVVVLSLVLFFALPMAVLIYVDAARLQAEVRYEIKQLKKLEKRLKEQNEKANSAGAVTSDGL